MIQDKPINLAPPWGSNPAWQEANRCIDIHVHRYNAKLKSSLTMAQDLRARLESIFPILEDLCTVTCSWCPEPCCLTASPWFDFRDLIFLHLNHLSIPLNQPIDAYEATCCYISPQGCKLPRIIRPWICIWYLCPVQKANLKKRGNCLLETFIRTIEEIKIARKQIEDEFICIIAE